MWAFLSGRLRQWLILAVVVPIVLTVVRLIRRRLEQRDPSSKVARGLRKVEEVADTKRHEARDSR